MILTTEIAVIVSSVLITLTFCLVKVCHQIQNSKCSHIEMCCVKCEREVTLDLEEAKVNEK
jgi:hypothetical protein